MVVLKTRQAWKDWTTAEFDYQVLKDSAVTQNIDDKTMVVCVFFSYKSLKAVLGFFSYQKILRETGKTQFLYLDVGLITRTLVT